MKKLFYSLFAFAALAMTNSSCSDELETGTVTNSNEATVSFSIQLENEVGSRAIGDGTTAEYLFFSVYKAKDATQLGDEVEALHQSAIKVVDKQATITTRLVKGQKYNFVFWAQTEESEDGSFYNIKDMSSIKVKYNSTEEATMKSADANNEKRDAFYAVEKNLQVTGPINKTITLRRPFGQVNVGTKIGSLAESQKAEVKITKSKMVISNVATTLYPYSGQVADATSITFTETAIPDELLKDVTINDETKDYEYLSMNYILVDNQNAAEEGGVVDGTQSEQVNATLTLYGEDTKDNTESEINTFSIPNIPVQRNWRTNIIGDILNETVTFNVVIDNKFENDHNRETSSYLEYAFANGGEVTLEKNWNIEGYNLWVAKGKTVTLNLNGYSITNNGGYGICLNEGATLTINGNSNVNEYSIQTKDGAKGAAIWLSKNSTVIINGGKYISSLDENNDGNPIVYAGAEGSKAIINGGYFTTSATDTETYLLNKNDDFDDDCTIEVKGGTFVNFDPADNPADGPGTSYVAEGYQSTKDADGNYVVTKK